MNNRFLVSLGMTQLLITNYQRKMNHISDSVLNQYLDRELETAVREQVAAHLAGCVACQARLAETERLFAAIEGVPEVPLTVDLSPAVVDLLGAELKPHPLPAWMRPVVLVQLVAALALVFWLWPVVGSALETVGDVLPGTAEQLLPSFSLSEMVEPLNRSVDELADFGRTFDTGSSLPMVEGFLIIGLALVLWLAGSGLLLRQSLLVENRS